MAKACDCGLVMEALERDPRLACLPLGARMVWLLLVRRMQAMGLAGLRLGSVVPNRAEIAMMVSVAETELETQLMPLLARGLLVVAADGALESPLLLARQKRAETARINGLKGGRPRRDGGPPGQRSMMLPIAGGAAGPATETQPEPRPTPDGLPAKLASSLPKEVKPASPRAIAADEVQRIGTLAMDAAGFDPARWQGHFGLVRTWLELGASEALILRVVARLAARPGARPRHFGFFDDAVREELAAMPAVVAAAPSEYAEPAAEYNARYEAWESAGRLGEAPQRRRAA